MKKVFIVAFMVFVLSDVNVFARNYSVSAGYEGSFAEMTISGSDKKGFDDGEPDNYSYSCTKGCKNKTELHSFFVSFEGETNYNNLWIGSNTSFGKTGSIGADAFFENKTDNSDILKSPFKFSLFSLDENIYLKYKFDLDKFKPYLGMGIGIRGIFYDVTFLGSGKVPDFKDESTYTIYGNLFIGLEYSFTKEIAVNLTGSFDLNKQNTSLKIKAEGDTIEEKFDLITKKINLGLVYFF
ncbi:MAG: hypothetical protein LBH46_00600 [Rickettsiales bacterium]|jgi:hypothetical protein|nr:hypothetical protein [Rickettsiales bacterium]